MLFNSYLFWAFFALVLLVYRRLGHKAQNRLILVASYVFYGAWDWRFCILLAATSVVDFVAARGIAAAPTQRRRKVFVLASVFANIGALGFFKYYDFFSHEMLRLMQSVGVEGFALGRRTLSGAMAT